jgi:hypothetical protein
MIKRVASLFLHIFGMVNTSFLVRIGFALLLLVGVLPVSAEATPLLPSGKLVSATL